MGLEQRKRVALAIWADISREIANGSGRTITYALRKVMDRQDMTLFRAHSMRIEKPKGPTAGMSGGGKNKCDTRDSSTPEKSNEVCRKWLAGTCTRGKKCRYKHPKGKEGSAAVTRSESDDDTPAAPVPKKGKK